MSISILQLTTVSGRVTRRSLFQSFDPLPSHPRCRLPAPVIEFAGLRRITGDSAGAPRLQHARVVGLGQHKGSSRAATLKSVLKQRASAADIGLPEHSFARASSLCSSTRHGDFRIQIRRGLRRAVDCRRPDAAIPKRTTVPRSKRRLRRKSAPVSAPFPRSSKGSNYPLLRAINGRLAHVQSTKRIQGSDLPVAGFEFVPDGGKLARKGVGTIALAGESQFLLRCDGAVCLGRPQHLGVRGSETCGTLLGLLPRRGKLAGERLGFVAFLPERQLLFDLRRLGGSRRPPGPRLAPYRVLPGGRLVRAQGPLPCLAPVRAPAFARSPPRRLARLPPNLRSARIEFRPEGGKFTRKGVCSVALLIKCLLLLDPCR